jgi:hypothetical protein
MTKPKKYHSEFQGERDEIIEFVLDDREICGLKGDDKVDLVVKIQT